MHSLILLAILGRQTPSEDYPSTTTKKTLYASSDLRGKAAPKLVVEKWLDGKAPETKGKVLIIDFWATWCPPCRATIPDLNKLAAKFSKDVVVIGISNENPEVVTKFRLKTAMNYNVAVDTQGRMSKLVGVQGIPHVLVISPDGIVRWQGFPLDDKEPLDEATVQKIVDANQKAKLRSL